MASVVKYPAGLSAMQAMLDTYLSQQAQQHADTLRDRLSHPGSGRHYPGQPNPSSAPGEYPAQQSRELRDSVDARPVAAGRYRIGFWAAPPYTAGLEFKPPSRGGRAPIRKFMMEVQAMP